MTEVRPAPRDSRHPHLEMREIVVAFGDVTVLDGAHLEVREGEIHALLGENGAGNSSLIKVLFGLYPRRHGEIDLRGSSIDIRIPRVPRPPPAPESRCRRGVSQLQLN